MLPLKRKYKMTLSNKATITFEATTFMQASQIAWDKLYEEKPNTRIIKLEEVK